MLIDDGGSLPLTKDDQIKVYQKDGGVKKQIIKNSNGSISRYNRDALLDDRVSSVNFLVDEAINVMYIMLLGGYSEEAFGK